MGIAREHPVAYAAEPAGAERAAPPGQHDGSAIRVGVQLGPDASDFGVEVSLAALSASGRFKVTTRTPLRASTSNSSPGPRVVTPSAILHLPALAAAKSNSTLRLLPL